MVCPGLKRTLTDREWCTI